MKNVVVIGAGVAGLSAAVYVLQSGFRVTVLERHAIPGGFCTSWKRRGYLFEGGLHWLTGSAGHTPLHEVWRNIGAMDEDTAVRLDDPFSVYLDGDEALCLYRDPDRLEAHLSAVAPEDSEAIAELCADIRAFAAMRMPVEDIEGVEMRERSAPPERDDAAMMPLFAKMGAYADISAGDYVRRFSHPGVRALLCGAVPENNAATALVFTLASFADGDGGYLDGGSLRMARKMAARVQALGGEIRYGSCAERVVTEGGRVTGVRVGGETLAADAVIVTQDALRAVDALFDPPLEAEWIARMRAETQPVLNTFIGLGVEADLSGLPGKALHFALDRPIRLGDIEYSDLGFSQYSAYPDYAPPGCTAVTVLLVGDSYAHWQRCREDGTYRTAKEELAREVIDRLSGKIPLMRGKVALVDVATPLTYERYCGAHKGSWMSVMSAGGEMESYPCTVGGVAGLYFAGQRMQPPGGLPVAAVTGRAAVQHLCRDQGIVFQGAMTE